MKRSAAVFAVTATVLSLGAAYVVATSEQGQELTAQVADRISLPSGCITDVPMEEVEGTAYVCTGVPVKDVLANKKIATASELFFEKSAFAGADFSGQSMVSLSIVDPVDPSSVPASVSSATIAKGLYLTNTPQSTLDDLKTDAELLHFFRDDSTGKPQKPHKAHSDTAPVAIFSDVFLEIDSKAAGEVRALSVRDPIDTKKLDLSRYSNLDKMSITVPSGTKVSLPEHLADSKDLKVSELGGWVSYEH